MSLSGKTAVITGASSGIGKATALELASCGAECLVHARGNQQLAQEVVEQISQAGGVADLVMVDLAADEGCDQLIKHAYNWREKIDIWVNVAGVDVLTGHNATLSFEQKLAALWPVDVLATIKLTRTVGQKMKQHAGGSIINIGWDQAPQGMMSGDSGEMFSAIKGAVMAFTQSAAKSLAPEVRVNCVAPGWIKTAWGGTASADWQKRAVGQSLLKRWGTAEDVAQAIRFLASPEASFITGQILPVNGGFDSEPN